MITPSEARNSSKNLNAELFSLYPSTLITMFEIDITDIAFDRNLFTDIIPENEDDRIFRFHNTVTELNSNIVWQKKLFYAAPIRAEGFELNSRGTLPVPKLSMSVSDDLVPLLSRIRQQLKRLGDLTGAKVTRIRTLYKYLDVENFPDNKNDDKDPNAEFPREVFYIDRKSAENKSLIEYELASILDVEGIKLPSRLVVANRCIWQYRGEGCLYEYNDNRVDSIHGALGNSVLPTLAPPVATEKDELITDLLPTGTRIIARGKWKVGITYTVGDIVYIEKSGIKYYFVAKITSNNAPPPNGNFWLSDMCSKTCKGCKLRYGVNEVGVAAPGRLNGNPFNNALPYGGFPATNKLR